ncbi:hypothetical protein LCGC14_2631480, partial [marine sediment metagenome]
MRSPDPAKQPFTLEGIIDECAGKGRGFPVSPQHMSPTTGG